MGKLPSRLFREVTAARLSDVQAPARTVPGRYRKPANTVSRTCTRKRAMRHAHGTVMTG
jgi:hypothetical protein